SAAGNTFGEDGSNFRYTREVMSGDHIILEFESTIDGKYVNGVDIMTWNSEGRISEFKVMIRPLQAVNLVHAKMKAMLEQMQAEYLNGA
ncbi:MAG: nuclear transport factor 2 family protein, partial [Gammaproteobacteria bacterium]|nr:nuclear transport factor 2 family protein [Gammaproteobacteria bacterium]